MKQKFPKSQDQCAEILTARLVGVKKYIMFILNKEKYPHNEATRREELSLARAEERALERAIDMLYDDRPLDVVLATDYCTGRVL